MKRGFTLIELLIVLAIIVIVSAIAVSIVQKPAERQEIQKAANTVRTKLFRARLGAMRSNRIFTFQYMSDSGSYRLAPDDNSSGQQADTANAAGEQPSAGGYDVVRPEEGKLPEGICFLPDNTPDPDASETAAETSPQNSGGDVGSGDGWSDPIYFYPDGTTSDARFVVASSKGFVIPIRLRGVTGNVVQGGISKKTM